MSPKQQKLYRLLRGKSHGSKWGQAISVKEVIDYHKFMLQAHQLIIMLPDLQIISYIQYLQIIIIITIIITIITIIIITINNYFYM